MLNAECSGFRIAFSPHDAVADVVADAAPHRAQCAACDAYAQRLEDAAQAPPRRLSANLKARLAAIPQLSLGCDDVDRLYALTRQRAHGARLEDAAAESHLLACRRCRELYGCLHDAMVQGQRSLPAPLFERLRQIARNPAPKLPVWVLDGRYATAVCYFLTAFLVLLAGDASARFQTTTEVVSARASTCLEAGLEAGDQWLESVREHWRQRFDDGQAWWTERRDGLTTTTSQGAAQLLDQLRQLDLDPRHWLGDEATHDPQPTEGDSDDRNPR